MLIISLLTFPMWPKINAHLPEPTFCILSRTHTTLEQNSGTKSQNSSTNFKSQNFGTNQLISSQMKLIQPLNPKHLRSTFPPTYSHTPIPIGINDHLLKDPQPLATADRE